MAPIYIWLCPIYHQIYTIYHITIWAIPHESLKGIRSSPGATVERLEPGAVPESDQRIGGNFNMGH